MEAVAGVTSASNIAVDDFNFSTNLTCFSVGKPTPPDIFEGKVSEVEVTIATFFSIQTVLS